MWRVSYDALWRRENDERCAREREQKRALTVGQGYWAAIESFDENGVSTLSAPVPIR